MTYLKNEISLLQSVKNGLREDVREALMNILDGYNKAYILALNQQKYINKKRPEYAKEMEDNFKLTEKNKILEETAEKYKQLNKSQIKYSKDLERELRMTKRLLESYQNNSNSKK